MRSLPLLGLFLATALHAAPAPQIDTTDQIQQAWKQFQEQNPGEWTAHWHGITRTPHAIYGPGLNLGRALFNAEEAQVAAEQVLRKHAVLLGKLDSDFVLRSNGQANETWMLIFDQRFKGLEVVGGRADCFIHESGVVSLFGSRAVVVPRDFNIKPALTAAVARRIAEESLLGQAAAQARPAAPELVIWTDFSLEQPGPVHLAWRVAVDDHPRSIASAELIVDARTGKVLSTIDRVYYCSVCKTKRVRGGSRLHRAMHRRAELRPAATTAPAAVPATARAAAPVDLTGTVMAWVDTGTSAIGPLQNVPLKNLLVRAATGATAYTDAQGNFTIANAGTSPVQVTAVLGGRFLNRVGVNQGTQMQVSLPITPGSPATLQFGNAASPEFDRAQMNAYYWHNEAYEYVRGLIPTATTQLNFISSLTPYVNLQDTCNAYYRWQNRSTNYYAKGGQCNNTAFSSVILHEWGHGIDDAFGGISQTDGLSEGWGDIISILRLQDPIVGRYFKLNGGAVRSALNSRTYPVGGTAPHPKGEVWMGFAWDLRSNLIAAQGSAPGHATTERIIIPSLLADATDGPGAVRAAFVVDDNDGNLNNGTPHYDQLSAAARKRNYPFPERKLAAVFHTPLTDTSAVLVPRVVQTRVTATSGSISKVELVYIEGLSLVTREMVPSGNTDEYLGMLPGRPGNADMRYAIAVTHSSNVVIRTPETGFFDYRVANDEVLFFDDFDGPNFKNWTHASTGNTSNNQDDWQTNTPAGKSGSGWRDPSAAASGQYCWGNDMGQTINGQGWNGEYQPNVESYLRSPNFSTLGYTGVRLRFKRWLTVQSGQFDQAEIRVNGAVVWSNPTTGNLIDSSWQTVDIPIPQADNRFISSVEFRLRTNSSSHFGGWNIDDVEIYVPRTRPQNTPDFSIKPEQVGLGQMATAEVSGVANAPALLLVAAKPGPLNVPGLPEIFVDASFLAAGLSLDAQGRWNVQFPAPANASSTGKLFYAQVLQLDNNAVQASNGAIVLIGK